MGNKFEFKHFTIEQERCGMKVGTDGVLLGAWAEGGRHVLDIGTGTGLIAIMMAQRFPESSVVAIDIDADACSQAAANVVSCPYSNRIEVQCSALQAFSSEISFDCIVSNPPFFINSLKNPDKGRLTARHTDTLSYSDLFDGVSHLLSEEGTFHTVIPADCLERFLAEASMSGLFVVRKCGVKTVARKTPKRYLLSFAKSQKGSVEDVTEVLENVPGKRSEWYNNITKNFYLR